MPTSDAPRFMSRTAEHAVRALLYLAVNGPESVKASTIARELGAPANYMSKTLHALASAGILSSRRGPTGGFRLDVDPDRLTLADIIEVVDDPAPKDMCLVGNARCSDRTPCALHGRWKKVSNRVWEPLRSTTLADLLDGAGTTTT
ncbi:MAG: Rrf2 family transcriptional regulator [Gemmatimonadetes bacterium]|nr:Rrf2 family transcriptional regulator [Gemmatimonadota bacterium]NIX43707.1 Rrf2 family transcriptional regulator [Gemmatimonadota bacterium]NIY07900.1 Rrf2 family transcriptional regulator [Gemmatimonadota bacterium]